MLLLRSLAAGALFVCFAIASTSPLRRHIEILNDSGRKVVVQWIDPSTGELVRFSDPYLYNGASLSFDSYINHSFIFQEVLANETACSETTESCRATQMTVRDSDDQVVFIKEDLKLEFKDSVLEARAEAKEVLSGCRSEADEALRLAQNPNHVMEDLMNCLEEEIAAAIQRKNEEKAFESTLRLQLSDQLEPYTCRGNQSTTEPIEVRHWVDPEGTLRDVGILHDRQDSKIHVMKNFITREECEAIQEAAKPTLHRGTVADGNGGITLSDHRKAWQAGVDFGWNDPKSIIAQVGRRVYAYANHATGYNLTTDGQEELMSIQYFGRGLNDTEPDQYKPHCDGECGGSPHKLGARVATMVMYCDVPEVGGGTNFQNANVFVKPELYAAAFFSYLDPVTRRMETGFTTHSGCPVYKGTKRIAVHWMRVGVDEESPWSAFDTNDIKKSAEEDC